MDIDQLLQLLILILAVFGGVIVQVFQQRKRTGVPPKPKKSIPGPPPPGDEDIARKVRKMLMEAAGSGPPKPEPKPKPVQPKVKEPIAPGLVELGKGDLEKGAGKEKPKVPAPVVRDIPPGFIAGALSDLVYRKPEMMVLGYEIFGPPVCLRRETGLWEM